MFAPLSFGWALSVSPQPLDFANVKEAYITRAFASQLGVQVAHNLKVELRDNEYVLVLEGAFQTKIGKPYASYTIGEQLLVMSVIVGSIFRAYSWRVLRGD
ncbi:MAG: hypothetical protein U0R49_03880 [Fimbriimonadales bacterium]